MFRLETPRTLAAYRARRADAAALKAERWGHLRLLQKPESSLRRMGLTREGVVRSFCATFDAGQGGR